MGLDSRELHQCAYQILEYTSKYTDACNLIGRSGDFPDNEEFASTYKLRKYSKGLEKGKGSLGIQDEDHFGAEDFITVLFKTPVIPTAVVIHEHSSPGAIVRIWGRLTDNKWKWKILWEGPPQICASKSRKFAPKINQINCLIDQVRVEFNQTQQDYHTAIDAICLTGIPHCLQLRRTLMMQCASGMENRLTYSRGTSLGKRFPELKQPASDLRRAILSQHLLELTEPVPDSASDVESMDQPDSLSVLPDELLLHIFKYLDLKSLSECAQVNRRLNVVTQDRTFYESVSLKRYSNEVDHLTLKYLENRCTNLKKLDLSWYGGENKHMEHAFIKLLSSRGNSLTHLHLDSCEFITETVIKAIGEYCKELTELKLRNCELHGRYKFIGLTKLNNLIKLDLSCSHIENDDIVEIVKANSNLKNINIDLCIELDMDHVVDMITSANQNLLSWSSWKTSGLTSISASYFTRCPNLQELDLGYCSPPDGPGECLRLIAEGCQELRRLVISGWYDIGHPILLPIIARCKRLIQLELEELDITGDTCEKILSELPDLKWLDVSNCNVSLEKMNEYRAKYPGVSIHG